jgi:F0F1-type ATP synthase membrane subunit b/b'
MGHSFGLNIRFLETNVLNLVVVLVIVVTVVGDAFKALLDQRRTIILLALKEADLKSIDAQKEIEEALATLEISRLRAKEIRDQAVRTVEQENVLREQELKKSINRLKESSSQSIQLERQRIVQSIVQEVSKSALSRAERTLWTTFKESSSQSPNSKHKTYNDLQILFLSNIRH